MRVEGTEGWKGGLQPVDDKLVEALRSSQVFQSVGSEVAQLEPTLEVSLDQASGRLRDEDLSSVRGARDSRRVMYVKTDVFVAYQGRFACMQAHADPEALAAGPGVVRKRALRRRCRCRRIDGAREHTEERNAFGPQLVPVIAVERVAKNGVVRGLRGRVAVSHLLHDPGRVLDVCEQERDCAAG